MAFREMLIKINSPEHSEAVQKKLFELGYEWANYGARVRNTRLDAMRCDDEGVLWCSRECHYLTEYPHLPWVDILAEQQQEVQEPVKPPIGLVPRSVFEVVTRQQRTKDIFAAMQRYAEAGKNVPVEWIDELKELIC